MQALLSTLFTNGGLVLVNPYLLSSMICVESGLIVDNKNQWFNSLIIDLWDNIQLFILLHYSQLQSCHPGKEYIVSVFLYVLPFMPILIYTLTNLLPVTPQLQEPGTGCAA